MAEPRRGGVVIGENSEESFALDPLGRPAGVSGPGPQVGYEGIEESMDGRGRETSEDRESLVKLSV